MERYYYVSYIFNSGGLGSGHAFTKTDALGINIRKFKEELEDKSNIKKVSVLNFKELTKEDFEFNTKKD